MFFNSWGHFWWLPWKCYRYQMVSRMDIRRCLLDTWTNHVPVCERKCENVALLTKQEKGSVRPVSITGEWQRIAITKNEMKWNQFALQDCASFAISWVKTLLSRPWKYSDIYAKRKCTHGNVSFRTHLLPLPLLSVELQSPARPRWSIGCQRFAGWWRSNTAWPLSHIQLQGTWNSSEGQPNGDLWQRRTVGESVSHLWG